ncbi:unnamed protein product [Rotaria sp. Silwood2]|nr:unnamed protein product [Rotaria sp. Silwood2]CAF4702896.1 unnamed protein product [Rotaria sp. Silwood2]
MSSNVLKPIDIENKQPNDIEALHQIIRSYKKMVGERDSQIKKLMDLNEKLQLDFKKLSDHVNNLEKEIADVKQQLKKQHEIDSNSSPESNK